jgi:hypothetical protein
MIVGGRVTESLHRRFGKLAGGAEAKIVCVSTAVPDGTLSGWCRRFFSGGKVPKKDRPGLPGIRGDEGTAAVVRRDTLRVAREGVIAIYDAHRWENTSEPLPEDEKYSFLRPGDRFDPRTRTVLVDQMEDSR